MRIDLRSLALFRIALGILLLSQAISDSQDFAAFYQAGGVSPSTALIHLPLRILIFGALPILGMALLVGFATRLSTLMSFLCLVLIQSANPEILQGGDVLLRLLLFWSLFLPLGRAWSIDALFCKNAPSLLPKTTRLASWAFTLQVCFVYWFAALLKSDPLWIQSGNALFYALNIEHFTTPFGLYLQQFPDFLRILTFGTIGLEFLGPILLLASFHRDRLRLAIVALFVGFHLIGMQSLLRIGLFPWVCAAAWLPFLPSSLWNGIEARIFGPKSGEKIKARVKAANDDKPWRKKLSHFLDYGCSVLVMAALFDVLAWNVASVKGSDSIRWMERHDVLGNVLKLEQRWNMYAPYPRKEHGWLVIPADLADGEEIDLFTGKPVSWAKPSDIGAYFGDDHWRRYLSNLFNDRNPHALQQYADYKVSNWNQYHDPHQKVQVVTIVFMKEMTLSDLSVTSPEKEVLYFRAF